MRIYIGIVYNVHVCGDDDLYPKWARINPGLISYGWYDAGFGQEGRGVLHQYDLGFTYAKTDHLKVTATTSNLFRPRMNTDIHG